MNNIQWKYEDEILAGTTLRDPSLPENNNMARMRVRIKKLS